MIAAADRAFRVSGPAVVSVSGGRTSAFLLYRILRAHDGVLPPDVFASFQNTGREMPATLDFVGELGRRWAVHIQWLEYRRDPVTGRQYAEPVSHNSASRNGEPFEQMLIGKGWLLPNPQQRSCTQQLKILTLSRWIAQELQWSRWINIVGLRFDELPRLQKAALRNAARKERFRKSCPLAKARITKAAVNEFWSTQPFDLALEGDWEGNCDGCFLKRIGAIRRMIQDHPARMAWWRDIEAAAKARGYTGGHFRIDRPGYAELIGAAAAAPTFHDVLDGGADDGAFDVLANCDGGCGT